MGTPMAERIMDLAEARIRTKGYCAFSFREIAEAAGVKSASVHYHFPTKGDLGAAVARRYTERFLEALGDPADRVASPAVLLERCIQAFRDALARDRRLCLCGVLGAEAGALPEQVLAEARRFFERSLEWLSIALSRLLGKDKNVKLARSGAIHILACLEGALILAKTLDDIETFDAAVAPIAAYVGTAPG